MASKKQNQIAKITKQNILNDLYNRIDLQIQKHTGRVPMGFVANLLRCHAAICPWHSRNKLNNEMRKRKRMGNLISSASISLVITGVTDNELAAPAKWEKGGRHVGATHKKKKNGELVVITAKNEISERYDADKKKVGKNYCPLGTLIESFVK